MFSVFVYCFHKEDPGSNFGNIERLVSLGRIDDYINFEWFSNFICGLQFFLKAYNEGGIPDAPKDLDQLECLEDLS